MNGNERANEVTGSRRVLRFAHLALDTNAT
jgi:hypothetical protein